MIEKLLSDRLVSIELYKDKLKKDSKKFSRMKNSKNKIEAKRALELVNTIDEVLTFIETYKNELNTFLSNGVITMEKYQEDLSRYDEKFFDVLKFIQRKVDAFNEIEK